MNAYLLMKFKMTSDILQGISKLDYYIKISIFQRNKNAPISESSTNLNVTEGNDDRSVSDHTID